MKLAALALAALPLAAAHSSLITPKPRNAIDSELPEWKDGNSPYYWVKGIGKDGAPCACRNGTGFCASAQTCLWFSVGCSLGCAECDGGAKGPGNPNKIDRCGANFKATNNDPRSRTINRGAEAGSEADWTKFVSLSSCPPFSTSSSCLLSLPYSPPILLSSFLSLLLLLTFPPLLLCFLSVSAAPSS